MSKRIFLENIVQLAREHAHTHKDSDIYCPECGEFLLEDVVTEEFVCQSCRNLVAEDAKFCSFCGEPLEDSGIVEHYQPARAMRQEEFDQIKDGLRRIVRDDPSRGVARPDPEEPE